MRYSTYSGHSFLRSIHFKSVPAIPESRYIVSRVTCIQRGKGVSGHPLCNSIDRATFGTHSTPAGKKNFFFFFRSRTTPERINISWLISVPRYQSNIFHLSFDVAFEIEKKTFTKTRKRERERETVSR